MEKEEEEEVTAAKIDTELNTVSPRMRSAYVALCLAHHFSLDISFGLSCNRAVSLQQKSQTKEEEKKKN